MYKSIGLCCELRLTSLALGVVRLHELVIYLLLKLGQIKVTDRPGIASDQVD